MGLGLGSAGGPGGNDPRHGAKPQRCGVGTPRLHMAAILY